MPLQQISAADKLHQLQEDFLATGDFAELEAFYNTLDYKKLSYQERNRGLITAHKLLAFERCGFCFAQEFINQVPNFYQDNEAFLIGSAFDDLMTEGQSIFDSKYAIVARRDAKTLVANGDKELLTMGVGDTIRSMACEYRSNKLFNQSPKKKIVLQKYEDFILKVELDGIDEEKKLIQDIKTTANIIQFSKDMARMTDDSFGRKYLFQMAFYAWVVSLYTGDRYGAILMVVDKHKISRSGCWRFDPEMLAMEVDHIQRILADLKVAYREGFKSAADQNTLYECPYYGYKGHGRPTQYF